MPSKYKLVVSDIDGTIANAQGDISPADFSALQRIDKNGVKLALSTGRAARGSIQVLKKLPCSGYHIFFDGALVCDSTLVQTIYSRPIENELLNQVIDLAHLHGLALELFSSTGYFIERDSPLAAMHRDLMQLEWTIMDYSAICKQESIIMGCLVIPTGDEQKFRPILCKYEAKSGVRFSWSIHSARPEIRMVNVIMKDVSKGSALTALCSYLGFKTDEVIAIGDGANDVSLLKAAGLAVAMQNSPPELKAIANYVTGDVAHNGFAQAMEKFLLQGFG
jgi:hypothetical protein